MKFLQAQGHFGVLDGQKIRFEDGLNVLYLPNEGGKTTLCSFLRVMLYGLNTSRRDSKNQLSDKTKYRPLDGNPMSGLLEIEWKGRRIILSRQTGRGTAPMQEFAAYYADTGEPCTELTAKDCGLTLTGVSEEGFRSSAMLDGQAPELSGSELGDRMLALSTTGDSAMMYANAMEQLDSWKHTLKGTGNRGRYAQVEADMAQIDEALGRLDALDREQKNYEEQLPEMEQQVAVTEQANQQATENFTMLFVAKREAAEREERQSRERLAQLKAELPDLEVLTDVERATTIFLEAQQAYNTAKTELDAVQTNYAKWKEQIDTSEDTFSNEAHTRTDIHIRGWSMALAIICGLLAVASLTGLLSFGAASVYMPYVFSVAAVAALIITFVGSTRTLAAPPMDFDDERVKLERRRQSAVNREAELSERLTQARTQFRTEMNRIAPEQMEDSDRQLLLYMKGIAEKKRVYLLRKREHDDLTERYLKILDVTGPQGEARRQMEDAKAAVEQARQAQTQLHEAIAACRGKAEEIGRREPLCAERERLAEEKESILCQVDAIQMAKESLVRANTELTGRVSPKINKLAQEYMRVLTANRYTAMQLYTNLEATCRRENSAVEMDRLRLSAGTRDQLYLALRLAVCKVLLDEGSEHVPLILDDPFINYDDQRAACGMKLLREIARDRQIILLTCRRP